MIEPTRLHILPAKKQTTLTTSSPLSPWVSSECVIVKRGKRTFIISRETEPRWRRILRWLRGIQ